MTLWAHTLVKNEAKWLWFAVSSVVDYVEKVLLWDTGSTDSTPEIIKELIKKYPDKIDFREYGEVTSETFTDARQEMLEATKADWFITLDGDEVWWKDSIKELVNLIQNKGDGLESIIIPNILPVGDIFHFQEEAGGKYKFAGRTGHFNLRAASMNIPGLHAKGEHGQMGWADGKGKMIQDRDSKKISFLDKPYFHLTYLPRAGENKDTDVVKRKGKLKYEIGELFPKDYFYPEVFFKDRPGFIESPWGTMDTPFKLKAFIETPIRKIKRRLWNKTVGY